MRFLKLMMVGLLFLGVSACKENQNGTSKANLTIKGTLKPAQKGELRLHRIEGRNLIPLDTILIAGNSFEIKAPQGEADFYILEGLGNLEIPLILGLEDIQVEINKSGGSLTYQVIGSRDNDYYRTLQGIIDDFRVQVENLKRENIEDTSKALSDIQAQYSVIQKKSITQVKAFMDTIAPSIVLFRAASLLDPETEIEYLNQLEARFKKDLSDSKFTKEFSQQMQALNKKMEATKHLQVGKTAPDISLQNPKGDIIKLSSLKGKVVLLDFWASWCGPCRAENPNVRRVYQQYKDQGFEIYGVSLDRDREDWLRAIENDQINWIHVSDLKYFYSKAAEDYQVNAIPATFLLDREGKIIAKNLRGPALEQGVEQALGLN